MAMSDYEPASGFNLPPGCFEDDLNAPWNEPDPWVGRKCIECDHCERCRLLDGSKVWICTESDAVEVDPQEQACGCFELHR